eukprot:CAMPEP_0202507948 /NCGR_PEP_ID=MMETSP1361-20130828/51991_1 /ASSEMBLY_ACC=CAM_ASM_000849 /TAXON_ID=210615 /ORGANISM="Staurosira complex sp., Strain CCMP2646" /LENGTH=303 /DNA_ID=CAMNT_0049142101 /DNA_START=2027 /DNA_END=2938 /DNA_ORIENTATION=-
MIFSLFVLLQVLCCARAFVSPRGGTLRLAHRQQQESSSRLHTMILILEENDEDDDNRNSEKNWDGNKNNREKPIRAAFGMESSSESSFKPMEAYITEWKEQLKNKPAPPLTTMRQARMEKEIALLERLSLGDDAVSELSNLWVNARGPNAANTLQIAETLAREGAWKHAEVVLLMMIQEEGLHFLAPISQLATLLKMQGRLRESKELHELVLSQKPWFMNSLLRIHSVCKKMNDQKELVKWDNELVPPMENQAKRAVWVHRMVKQARDHMKDAQQGLQSFFDNNFSQLGSEGSVLVENEDSWQ